MLRKRYMLAFLVLVVGILFGVVISGLKSQIDKNEKQEYIRLCNEFLIETKAYKIQDFDTLNSKYKGVSYGIPGVSGGATYFYIWEKNSEGIYEPYCLYCIADSADSWVFNDIGQFDVYDFEGDTLHTTKKVKVSKADNDDMINMLGVYKR